MLKKHLEKIEENCKSKLDSSVRAKVENFGSVSTNANLSQNVCNTEVWFEEICHIIPKAPLYKPGSLLKSKDDLELPNNDDPWSLRQAQIAPDFVSVDIGTTKEIGELGTVKRILCPEVIMVLGESIEIKRRYKYNFSYTQSNSSVVEENQYTIRHLLQVINNKQKHYIVSKLFKEPTSMLSAYSYDIQMNNSLDLEYVMMVYERADRNEIISPLQVVSNE